MNCNYMQPDRVTDFCERNKLQLIIRAHECVMDGFERFAQGQLITLFLARNYFGTANNAGAILVIGLVVVPKLIHPLPPPLEPETSSEYVEERHWMQELNRIVQDHLLLHGSGPSLITIGARLHISNNTSSYF